VTLVESARESPNQYRKLARIAHVFAGGHAWPHIALADGLLYCKDREGKLKCFSTTGAAGGNAADKSPSPGRDGR
jgi:hypothetical protein